MADKGLSINTGKCEYQLFTESTVMYTPAALPHVNGQPIPETTALGYLGVIFDRKLSWCLNTNAKTVKAKQAIGSLRRITRNKLNHNQMKTLILSKVVPIFTYGITTTYPHYKRDKVAYERLQRYAFRVSLNDFVSCYTVLLQAVKALPVYRQVAHKRALLGHSYAHHHRHLPEGTIRQPIVAPYNRRRFHRLALIAANCTSLETRNSALEECLLSWNRLESPLSEKSFQALKAHLHETNYSDHAVEPIGMLEAVRLL